MEVKYQKKQQLTEIVFGKIYFEIYGNISADINKFFYDTVVNKTAKLLTQVEVIFETEKGFLEGHSLWR